MIYDDAILYIDYFLSETIGFLKNNTQKFETIMVYASDHGGSLGEYGFHLYGLANFMAPKEQRKVGVIFRVGNRVGDIDKQKFPKK